MKKSFIALGAALFLAVVLAGCGNAVKGKSYSVSILGIEVVYNFKTGNEVIFTSPFSNSTGTYTYSDGKITVEFLDLGTEEFTYIKDADAIEDSDGMTYTRKKE